MIRWSLELLVPRPRGRGGVVQSAVRWKIWPGVRSSRNSQVWLASIYNYDCGMGFRACSPPPLPHPSPAPIISVRETPLILIALLQPIYQVDL